MQRNYSIDILKALCAFLVIILHVAWAYTDTFLPLARAAVPVFFMISGYFMYRDSAAGVGADRLRRALRRIGMITLWATLLFHRLERTDVAGAEPPPFHPFHC